MDLQIDGDVALVTASTSGLGEACARSLAAEGANVVVNGRDEEKLAGTVEALEDVGPNAVVGVPGDLTDADDRERLVARTVEEFGGVDHVVTSAGGIPRGHFLEVTEAQWQHAFDLLVMSVVGVTRHAAEHLQRGDGGSIVTIASTYSKEAQETYVLSNAVRMCLLGLSKTLSRELAPEVRANAVLPGWHQTPLTEGPVHEKLERGEYDSLEEGLQDRLSGYDVPLGRMGEPEELGDTVAYLCSDRASYVNGAALVVDGGKTRSNL